MLKWYRSALLLAALLLSVSMMTAQDAGLVDALKSREDFSTLATLVEAAGLLDVLEGGDALTIFAPTNAAFEALPPAVTQYLTSEPALLSRVLTYHVVPGALLAADVTTTQLESVEGGVLDVVVDTTGVHVDGVDVIETDIMAGSSVLHALNGVLIPAIELEEVDPLEIEGDLLAAGSSTVSPLTQRMADLFSEEGYADTITIDVIGTGAGFERFCVAAETDIANASRAIRESEVASCQSNGRTPIEFRVGTDALAIVVSTDNDFLTNLTLEQLALIYSGEARLWSDVDPAYPAEAILLYSPGTDSGTFDYFVEEIFSDVENGEELIAQAGAQFSENDNVLVLGVESSPYAIGYFGYAYYQENAAGLKILDIEGVTPTATTAESGEYPLARPLFIYSDANIIAEKPQVGAFIAFYLTEVNDEILAVGYFPASKRALNLSRLSLLAAL